KVTRQPGVAALTAGPGVTNGMSAMAGALQNNSPMVVLGGRAPQMRWGQGSLQEIDHVPFIAPVTRSAETAPSTAGIPSALDRAFAAATGPHGGPAFVDFALVVGVPMDFRLGFGAAFGEETQIIAIDAAPPER